MTTAKIPTPEPTAKPSSKFNAALAVATIAYAVQTVIATVDVATLPRWLQPVIPAVGALIAFYFRTNKVEVEMPDDEGETGDYTGA